MVRGPHRYLPTEAEFEYFSRLTYSGGAIIFTPQEIAKYFQILFAERAGNYKHARELIRTLDPTSTGKMALFCREDEEYKNLLNKKVGEIETLLRQEICECNPDKLPNNTILIEQLSLTFSKLQQEHIKLQTLEQSLEQQKKAYLLRRQAGRDEDLNPRMTPLSRLLNQQLGVKKSPQV